MPNPSKSPATEDGIDVVKAELCQKLFQGCFVLKFSSTHPPNHGAVVLPEPLQIHNIWCPVLTTVQHGRPNQVL